MTKMATLTVDEQEIQAPEGDSLLSACLAAGIMIPHLCWMETDSPDAAPASCRLCLVEIDGFPGPVTSCTVPVKGGMTVRTNTPAVRKLQISALKFLLSVHKVDCKHCPAHKACGLQDMARFLKIGLSCKPYDKLLKEEEKDDRHPVFDYYVNRCVHCGICIRICGQKNPTPLLTFSGRGFDTRVGYVMHPDSDMAAQCRECRACVAGCPTGALVEKPAV